MASVKETMTRIDALPLKERVLLFVAALVVGFALWQLLLMEPLATRQRQAQQDIAQKRDAIAAFTQQAEEIRSKGTMDPDAETRARLDRLRQQLAATRKSFAENRAQFVAPEQMAEVLKTVLGKFEKLTFLGLTGLGSTPLRTESAKPVSEVAAAKPATAAPAPANAGAYRHGLRIEFSGPYLDTLNYLRDLEALPWKFLWDSVEYEVSEYPNAKCAIVVYTLSLDQTWIGI